MSAIPLSTLEPVVAAARRARLVRTALLGATVAVIAAAAVLLARPRETTTPYLPSHADAIVVLDLSASISSDTYERIGATLRDLARTRARVGLVAFSDVAYRALPPGTPARTLRDYARFFTLPKTRGGFLPQFPTNPWTNTFSAGTRISAGLGLALQTIRDDRLRHTSVVLVSDLDDDPGDLQNLASVALAYKQLAIPVRVVALNPQPGDAQLFARLLGSAAHITPARLPGERSPVGRAPLPGSVVAAAVALALLLAAFELWSAELTWGRTA